VRVAVTGATGTIGQALVRRLLEQGDEVTVLSRDAAGARERLGGSVEALEWPDPKGEPPPADALRGRDGVVNLLGERLDQRWSDDTKREIRDSRVLGTRNLVAALRDLPESERPAVLVSQSASGYYGPRGDEPVDESEPAGDDFLAGVVAAWEAAAREAEEVGLRVVVTRTGVDDSAGAIAFCLRTEGASGPVNISAPEPATNAEFSKALGRVLRRPAVLPVPGLALKLLYGEMAQVVTTGVRMVPARLQELRYEFRHPELDAALRDATGRG
jgi:NAD dependent epimerase/dehydratase family enzyme